MPNIIQRLLVWLTVALVLCGFAAQAQQLAATVPTAPAVAAPVPPQQAQVYGPEMPDAQPVPTVQVQVDTVDSRKHIVQRGEVLSTIAPRYGMSWQDLCARNSLANCNTLSVGQELAIDGGSAPVDMQAVAYTAPVAAPDRAQQVIDRARDFLGMRYKMGGTGEGSIDCSRLMQIAFEAVGIRLPRVSYEQAAMGQRVSFSDLQPGDIVYWNSPDDHVALYLGNGRILNASSSRGEVVERDIYRTGFSHGARVL